MERRSWMGRYGAHVAICIAVVAVTFGLNRKIETDRSHAYVVAPTVVLEELTEFREDGGRYLFKGWGFDPRNYSERVSCELILRDTDTGESLWPTMDRSPERQEIPERYADGGDYSAGSFAGEIPSREVDGERVYEILLRYTMEGGDGDGSPYIVTVTTDEFLHRGVVTRHDPRTAKEPEIAGTALEGELQGSCLFHYFEEGMWVYVKSGRMYYVLDSQAFHLEDYPEGYMAVNWQTASLERIPMGYRQYGCGNADFGFMEGHSLELSSQRYLVSVRDLPSEYTTALSIVFYDRASGTGVFGKLKQLKGY